MTHAASPSSKTSSSGWRMSARRSIGRSSGNTMSLRSPILIGSTRRAIDISAPSHLGRVVANAPVGSDLAAGDPFGFVGREPDRGVADVLRIADAQQLLRR